MIVKKKLTYFQKSVQADIDICDLFESIKNNDLKKINFFKNEKKHIFRRFINMHNSIHYLLDTEIRLDKTNIITFLINNKSDFKNFKFDTGLNLFMTAVSYGSLKNMQILLDYGMDISEQNLNGTTALHIAVNHRDIDILDFLLKNKINIKFKDNNNSLFHFVNGFDQEKNIKVLKMLLNYGVDINIQNQTGKSALHIAAHAGKLNMIYFLIDNDINVDLKDVYGNDFLSYINESIKDQTDNIKQRIEKRKTLRNLELN